MRSINRYGILVLATLLVLSSCVRRKLEHPYFEKALIPIGVEWTRAQITPQNVTALFYDQADGKLAVEHRFEHNSNRIQTRAAVSVGTYTVVLFNEIRDQIDGVGIRGHESLSTLEAYALNNPSAITRVAGPIVREPGVLATVVVRDFVVTQQMVEQTQSSGSISSREDSGLVPETLVGLVPERKVSQVNVTVHVRGLNNARMPALAYFHNMSGGYLFDSDRNTTGSVSHQFNLSRRTYNPGSTTDGFLSGSIRTFGLMGDRNSVAEQPAGSPLLFDLLIMLVDAERTVIEHLTDITHLIEFSTLNSGEIHLNLDISLGEPLPDVTPEGDDSGFGSDLVDWGVIEVPLIAK